MFRLVASAGTHCCNKYAWEWRVVLISTIYMHWHDECFHEERKSFWTEKICFQFRNKRLYFLAASQWQFLPWICYRNLVCSPHSGRIPVAVECVICESVSVELFYPFLCDHQKIIPKKVMRFKNRVDKMKTHSCFMYHLCRMCAIISVYISKKCASEIESTKINHGL